MVMHRVHLLGRMIGGDMLYDTEIRKEKRANGPVNLVYTSPGVISKIQVRLEHMHLYRWDRIG